MAPVSTAIRMTRDRWFFSGMAIIAALTVFGGFAPTYYLKGLYGTPTLSTVRHLHGITFTLWMVLLLVQTTLISAGRTAWHRRLGVAGIGLAAGMLIIGTAVAISAARHPPAHGVAPGLPPPLVFLLIPLSDLAAFAILAGSGLYYRRKPDVHKRLMLLATIAILPAALGRMVFPGGVLDFLGLPVGPLTLTGLTALFVGGCLLYDCLAHGRVYAATLWGGSFLLVLQVLRLFVAGTAAWLTVAAWLTS
jgi:uncharacterized membrane protein YozB (DUF420 family)